MGVLQPVRVSDAGRPRRLRVLAIAGTRPEAIKFAPLIRALRARAEIEPLLVATGQHRAMFHQALAAFGLAADVDLALPNPSIERFCAGLKDALPALFAAYGPDLVLVQGDTSSALAAAQAAHAAGVAVGHVEAGLRSGDPLVPWPEEYNRRTIDALSTLLFAPTEEAVANLAGEKGRVFLTGNTGIDALLWMRRRLPMTLHDSATKRILVTCHRREAIPRLGELQRALLRLADRDDVHIHIPVHPNPLVEGALRGGLGRHPRILIEPALAYPDLVRLLDAAHLLLTDSGGLQEEAPALGLPTLVLRDVTERPEPVASGNAILVGLDPERIVAAATRLLDDGAAHAAMCRPVFPYGRGDASARIADAIVETQAAHPAIPPTARSRCSGL